MNNWILIGIFVLLSYLVGSINWAIIISKFQKKDIRTMGSGNPGTLNMSRNLGLKWGIITFLLDVLKGAVPTLVAFIVFYNRGVFLKTTFAVYDIAIYLCGLGVILGHIYPVFLKFKGGKGIASTIGVFVVTESVHGGAWFVVAVMAIVAALAFIYFTEFGAMGSFIAITPPAVSGSMRLYIDYANGNLTTMLIYMFANLAILLICFLTWYAHKKNIKRMLAGEEHPTSIKQMVIKHKLKKAEQKRLEEKNQQNIS